MSGAAPKEARYEDLLALPENLVGGYSGTDHGFFNFNPSVEDGLHPLAGAVRASVIAFGSIKKEGIRSFN